MKLSSKFELNPLTLVFFGIGLLTGYFKYIFYIFMIVLVHELGHVAMAKIFKRKIIKVELLPFGGMTKFEGKISEDIFEDLLIAIGGVLTQTILGYVMLILGSKGSIEDGLFTFLNTYNIFIIGFNLIPICPLDGYKIVKLFAELFVPYRIAYTVSIFISITFLLGAGVFYSDILINNVFVLIFLIITFVGEVKMRRFVEMKFYIERMNYEFFYSKVEIESMKKMFKNRTNYIKGQHERRYLKDYFTSKNI